MKVKEKEKVGSTAILSFTPATVALEHIATSKNLPTREIDSDHVEELVQSIRRSGLDTPIDVWGGEKDGTKMKIKDTELPASFLIAGAHRREALRRIAKDDPKRFAELFPDGVPVNLRVCPLKDALLLQLRENVQRKEMSSQQLLPVIKHLEELGLKQNQIASRIGKSPAWLSMIVEVQEELGDEAVEEVGKGLTMREARAAAKQSKADRKSGKPVDKKAALAAAKAKSKSSKGDNDKRAKKRVGLKVLYNRYNALPGTKMSIGRKVQVLEAIIEYAIGEANKIPDEVKHEVEDSKD